MSESWHNHALYIISLTRTSVSSWCPVPGVSPEAPASHGYQGGFRVQLMRKDFALAVDTAARVGANLALGEKGLEVYTSTMNDPGCKGLDSRVIYRYLGGDEDWEEKLKIQKK
jgi:3-hydroxyisobutyrate dehydrogenase